MNKCEGCAELEKRIAKLERLVMPNAVAPSPVRYGEIEAISKHTIKPQVQSG